MKMFNNMTESQSQTIGRGLNRITNEVTQSQSADFVAVNIPSIYLQLSAALGGEWQERGLVAIKDQNPKDKHTNLNIATAASNADWNINSGDISDLTGLAETITADLRAVPLSTIDTYERFVFKPNEWRSNFPDWFPKGNLNFLTLNPLIVNVFMTLFAETLKVKYSSLIVNSTISGGDPVDGLIKQIELNPDVIDEANQGIITVSNAIPIIQAMYNSATDRMGTIPKNEMPFLMNHNTLKTIKQADRNSQTNSTILTTETGTSFEGHNFEAISSIPDNVIIFCRATSNLDTTNLVLGTWMNGDETAIKMYIPFESINTKIDWRFALSGITIRVGAEIVYYKGTL